MGYIFIYRLFNNPVCPPDDIIQNCISNFVIDVDKCLRLGSSGRHLINVQFRHDCFRFLFNHCSDKKKLYHNDFKHDYFFPGWEQCIKNHETQKNTHGVRVLFPIETVSLYIKWMPKGHYQDSNGRIIKKASTFKEMIRFRVKKENF